MLRRGERSAFREGKFAVLLVSEAVGLRSLGYPSMALGKTM